MAQSDQECAIMGPSMFIQKKYTQRENRFIFIYIYSFTHRFFFIMYTHSTIGHIKVLKFPTVESQCRSKQTDLTSGRDGKSRSSVYKI